MPNAATSYTELDRRRIRRVRDLTLLEMNEQEYLVVACDSDGAIGSKPLDVVQVSPRELGVFALRVPLFEVIACGARPVLVLDCLCVEMTPYGAEILAAIRQYAAEAGLVADEQFTGSTEENVPTAQTGIGVTVLGIAARDALRPGTSREGDVVLCVGVPKSGPKHRITLEDKEILTLRDLIALRGMECVHDVLPVGSRGVLWECREMAGSAHLAFDPEAATPVDMAASAGPSTCVLASVDRRAAVEVVTAIAAPATVVGQLTAGGAAV